MFSTNWKIFSAFSKNWKIFSALSKTRKILSVFSKTRKILSTFSNLAQGKYEKSDEEKLEKNFRTFRVFRAVRVFALAVGTHVMEVFNEVKRYWTRSTQVEAKYTLNFI